MAFLGIRHGFVQGSLGQTDGYGADKGTGRVEGIHGDAEALAFPADTVCFRNDHVFQDQFARIGRADAHLVFFLADLEARRVAGHDESRQATDTAVLARVGEDQIDIGDTTIGDKGLRPVQGIGLVFLIMYGTSGNTARVGARTGFRQREGGQAAVVQHVAPHLFCSSLPARRTGAVARELAAMEVATPAQPLPSSS